MKHFNVHWLTRLNFNQSRTSICTVFHTKPLPIVGGRQELENGSKRKGPFLCKRHGLRQELENGSKRKSPSLAILCKRHGLNVFQNLQHTLERVSKAWYVRSFRHPLLTATKLMHSWNVSILKAIRPCSTYCSYNWICDDRTQIVVGQEPAVCANRPHQSRHEPWRKKNVPSKQQNLRGRMLWGKNCFKILQHLDELLPRHLLGSTEIAPFCPQLISSTLF